MILLTYFNRIVTVYLKDKSIKVGSLIAPVDDGAGITAWHFIPDRNNAEYRKTNDPALLEVIPHSAIAELITL
ncbi:MAG: hypothetical protein EOO08_01715 [Chitinophagaceae bacterium]|nr:MAG: hypothetical protein EOO08_01715 [Chitinophagaceae bacterium]